MSIWNLVFGSRNAPTQQTLDGTRQGDTLQSTPVRRNFPLVATASLGASPVHQIGPRPSPTKLRAIPRPASSRNPVVPPLKSTNVLVNVRGDTDELSESISACSDSSESEPQSAAQEQPQRFARVVPPPVRCIQIAEPDDSAEIELVEESEQEQQEEDSSPPPVPVVVEHRPEPEPIPPAKSPRSGRDSLVSAKKLSGGNAAGSKGSNRSKDSSPKSAQRKRRKSGFGTKLAELSLPEKTVARTGETGGNDKLSELLKSTKQFISVKRTIPRVKLAPSSETAKKSRYCGRPPVQKYGRSKPKPATEKKRPDPPKFEIVEATVSLDLADDLTTQMLTPSENSSFSFAPSVLKPQQKYKCDAELATSLALANRCIKEIHRSPRGPQYSATQDSSTATSTLLLNTMPRGKKIMTTPKSARNKKSIAI